MYYVAHHLTLFFMPFHKLTISQTFIESKSFGRTGNQLSVGTLCLRAFQMLDLKGDDSSHSQGMAEGDLGPLQSVMRQEALPMAIRLLGANFHSQESIVSFSNILTDIKLNPSKFLGLAVNLINLLKSQDSGSPAARPDDDEPRLPPLSPLDEPDNCLRVVRCALPTTSSSAESNRDLNLPR